MNDKSFQQALDAFIDLVARVSHVNASIGDHHALFQCAECGSQCTRSKDAMIEYVLRGEPKCCDRSMRMIRLTVYERGGNE